MNKQKLIAALKDKDIQEDRAKKRAYQKLYSRSEKGKATAKRFFLSDKGEKSREKSQKSPRGKYSHHKSRARLRKIEWLFTFETWWKVWEPYWGRMGQASNDLQMCRTGDKGPYSPENVRIDTCANNTREMLKIRRSKK